MHTVVALKVHGLVLLVSAACANCSALSSNVRATIEVCTGPDCRVDGATECLRRLQKSVSASGDLRAAIRVTGRACVGPCGDGPCVMITDASSNEKVIVEQPSKRQIALVPPELFASNPKGWYQVRTESQLEQVMDLAAQAAGIEYTTNGNSKESIAVVFVKSSRAWFDRPRNERKVLQRLMQALVLFGVGNYEKNYGELGSLQYQIAVGLFLVSDFIMKENLWTAIFKKLSP